VNIKLYYQRFGIKHQHLILLFNNGTIKIQLKITPVWNNNYYREHVDCHDFYTVAATIFFLVDSLTIWFLTLIMIIIIIMVIRYSFGPSIFQ